MQRGEIWWADLPAPIASEPGDRRPILLIQFDAFNRSRIQTVIAVALSTNLRLAAAPGNVLLPAAETGLPKDAVANSSQIITVDKSLLSERVSQIDHRLLVLIEDGIRLVLAL